MSKKNKRNQKENKEFGKKIQGGDKQPWAPVEPPLPGRDTHHQKGPHHV